MSEHQPGAETQGNQDRTLQLVKLLNDQLVTLAADTVPSEQIEIILQNLVDFIAADTGVFWLYRSDTGRLEPVISVPERSEASPGRLEKPDEDLIGLVGQERQAMLVQDYPQWAGEHLRGAAVQSPLSMLAVPVLVAGRIEGVLSVASDRDPYHFNEADLQVAGLFARLAAAALQAERRLQTIENLKTRDSLTGVLTRSRFFEMAEQVFNQAVRYQRPLSAVLVDIDRFKMLNEMHGFAVGDQVLKTVAENIANRLRDSDLVGRHGGEEFVLLLPETDLQHARLAAERIRAQIAAAPTETSRGTFFVTISAGVATLAPASITQLERLLDLADKAAHQAKLAGRNQVVVHEEEETSVRI